MGPWSELIRLGRFTVPFTMAVFIAVGAVHGYVPEPPGPLPTGHPPIEKSPAPGSADAMSETDQARLARAANELVAALERDPGKGANWASLGRIYLSLGLYDSAATAFARALDTGTVTADIHFQHGEALVYASGDTIPAEARAAFGATLRLDASHPGARYYLALDALQAGKHAEARAQLLALEKDSASDAPWLPLVRMALADTVPVSPTADDPE